MIRMGMIGCGNMGGAMLRKMLDAGLFAPGEIIVSDKNADRLRALRAETGVEITDDNRQAARAPILFLAVKPQIIRSVADEIAGQIPEHALIFSIVTGYDLGTLAGLLGNQQAHIVRVMPNTPALVGAGVLAACRSAQVTADEWALALRLLACMGMAQEVPEALMDTVTGVAGSSPAFAFMFLEALSDAGVRGGLSRELADRFAAQVLLGSAKLMLETEKSPAELKNMVTSPGGTTIEGVAALENRGFRAAVLEAVDAAIRKAKALKD